MAAVDFDIIPLTETDPYLEPSYPQDEPQNTDRPHTAAVMDTDKTS